MTDNKKGMIVQSTIGALQVDAQGAPIGAVRMDPDQAYVGVADLLRSVIDEADQAAWEKIKETTDYIYQNLDHALALLNQESGFDQTVKAQVKAGKKLFFKPNVVSPACIQPSNHGKGRGYLACVPWSFVAALMRWFHDKLDISYHEMAVGEAGTGVTLTAEGYTRIFGKGRTFTPEAILEGRAGDFYGGWGFYFARKYLAERHQPGHTDDPMNGYEESVAGQYFPPGRAGNRLMVYDLNGLKDIQPRGRDVPVPSGSYYRHITLHKAVVGGDPNDPTDQSDYPGCVLVNVSKLKVHNCTLLTNAIKNLGIGLFPMEATFDDDPDSTNWKYSHPPGPDRTHKLKVPHRPWHPTYDVHTGQPVTDEHGEVIMTKTAGLDGAMLDLLKAVQHQGIYWLNVVDAIEAVNVSHDTAALGKIIPEGYAFASLDPVATDVLGARYLFKTVPMAEARQLQSAGKVPIDFVQRVAAPRVEGQNIIDGEGYDAPIARCSLFEKAEKQGLGTQNYHVVGWDAITGTPLASVQGHLGHIAGQQFVELITPALYYDIFTLYWSLQTTIFGYLRASDSLTGTDHLRELLATFDENGDGIVDYDEMGRIPFQSNLAASPNGKNNNREFATANPLRQTFLNSFDEIKGSNPIRNGSKQNLALVAIPAACQVALGLSQAMIEAHDSLFPAMTWGKGKWPSVQYALLVTLGRVAFGPGFPLKVDLQSLYGQAFQYADKVLNEAKYTGISGPKSNPDSLEKYLAAVTQGAPALDFVLFVPKGLPSAGQVKLPNLEETDDPAKVFTAAFNDRTEIW